MKRSEYQEMIYAIETIEEREKELCARYIELNPEDKARRERDRDLILLGLYSARQEIERRRKNGYIQISA